MSVYLYLVSCSFHTVNSLFAFHPIPTLHCKCLLSSKYDKQVHHPPGGGPGGDW